MPAVVCPVDLDLKRCRNTPREVRHDGLPVGPTNFVVETLPSVPLQPVTDLQSITDFKDGVQIRLRPEPPTSAQYIRANDERGGRQEPKLDPMVHGPARPAERTGQVPHSEQAYLLAIEHSRDAPQSSDLLHVLYRAT